MNMHVLSTVKQMSIATGLYRPMRWLSRKARPTRLRAFLDDVGLYRSLLPPEAVCFDVGANIGEKSEALLRAGAKRVVAFEPNPQVVPELRARCGHWRNWILVEAALGSAPGFATLYTRERHGQSGLREQWDGRITGRCDVPVLTLDMAIQYFGRPFYCKIDVEGWELEVLKGLNQPLPLVSLEFALVEHDIAKTLACLERLNGFGAGEVNITPAEASSFHFAEWDRLERFRRWFPGDLKRTLPRDIYGDLYVRTAAA
jgi:FkbM family methyltransferase